MRTRAASVLLALTTLVWTLMWVGFSLFPHAEVGRAYSPAAEQQLAALALVVLTGALLWIWFRTTLALLELIRHGTIVRPNTWIQRLALAICGASLVVPPSHADPGDTLVDQATPQTHLLSGLPLPEVPTMVPTVGPLQPEATIYEVKPGDSLWRIAERQNPHAKVSELAELVMTWHALNADLIGPNPNLLIPGQQLAVPHPESR